MVEAARLGDVKLPSFLVAQVSNGGQLLVISQTLSYGCATTLS